jgi:hypothetical protein
MFETLENQKKLVFSYVITSADMRHVEIERRDIYLLNDPTAGLLFQGEISGCGPSCIIDLSEIFLEYAMNCKGCKEQDVALEEAVSFGKHIGEIWITNASQDITELPTRKKLSGAINCILNSMSARYIEKVKKDRLEYSLEWCPISECAKCSGLNPSVEMAHLSFTSLCKKLLDSLAPDWVLVQPSVEDTDIPIHTVAIAKL